MLLFSPISYYLESGHLNTSPIGCFFDKDILFFTIVLLTALVLMIISAWKAPKRVRPLGRIALSFTILKVFMTIIEHVDARMVASPDWNLIYGFRVWYSCTTVAILGLSVYLISIIIDIIRTPRI